MGDTMFADLAERVLAEAAPAPEGGFDERLWGEIESAGLDRLLLPEELGGAGDAFDEAVAVMIAFGRAGAALPLADTLVANWCLSKARLDVPEGPKALLVEPDARREESGLSGVAYWLPAVRNAVLVSEIEDVVSVESLTGLPGTPGESICGEPLMWLGRNEAMAFGLGRPANLAAGRAVAIAAIFEAAAIVGALEAVCTLSVDYANTRTQFGKPIARFQAVQALMARLASEAAAARAAVEHAATTLGEPGELFWAGIAKARASEAAGKAAACAHQIHGAIGFTREYELHRHTRRLWAWRERRGNELYWNQRIGAAAVRCNGKEFWSGLLDGLKL